MKRCILFFTLCACFASAKCENVIAPNLDGDIFHFRILNDSVVCYSTSQIHYQLEQYIYKDTLYLPKYISYKDKRYYVQVSPLDIIPNATAVIPKVWHIPNTYSISPFTTWFSDSIYTENDFNYGTSTLNYIEVEEGGRYLSDGGVVYSKDKDTLFIFPNGRQGTFILPNSVKYISDLAFITTSLDTLVIPNSVQAICSQIILGALYLSSFRYPNAIRKLDANTIITGKKIEDFIFGSGLECIEMDFVAANPSLKRVTCLAVTPPQTNVDKFVGAEKLTLFVPRKSIGLYRQARGWNSFFAIEPIEPPIVAGLNDATMTWVTNANVSYYTLTLYLDESKTIRLLTLTFDDRGYLQNMDINPDAYSSPYSAPQRSINTLDDDEEDINGYQSSMSFTITGLR